jgi:hypothetical protein
MRDNHPFTNKFPIHAVCSMSGKPRNGKVVWSPKDRSYVFVNPPKGFSKGDKMPADWGVAKLFVA